MGEEEERKEEEKCFWAQEALEKEEGKWLLEREGRLRGRWGWMWKRGSLIPPRAVLIRAWWRAKKRKKKKNLLRLHRMQIPGYRSSLLFSPSCLACPYILWRLELSNNCRGIPKTFLSACFSSPLFVPLLPIVLPRNGQGRKRPRGDGIGSDVLVSASVVVIHDGWRGAKMWGYLCAGDLRGVFFCGCVLFLGAGENCVFA